MQGLKDCHGFIQFGELRPFNRTDTTTSSVIVCFCCACWNLIGTAIGRINEFEGVSNHVKLLLDVMSPTSTSCAWSIFKRVLLYHTAAYVISSSTTWLYTYPIHLKLLANTSNQRCCDNFPLVYYGWMLIFGVKGPSLLLVPELSSMVVAVDQRKAIKLFIIIVTVFLGRMNCWQELLLRKWLLRCHYKLNY